MKVIYVEQGELYVKEMPYSEAAMHMRIAGEKKGIRLVDRMVMVSEVGSHEWEYGPVTPGEAGLYYDDSKKQYYFHAE